MTGVDRGGASRGANSQSRRRLHIQTGYSEQRSGNGGTPQTAPPRPPTSTPPGSRASSWSALAGRKAGCPSPSWWQHLYTLSLTLWAGRTATQRRGAATLTRGNFSKNSNLLPFARIPPAGVDDAARDERWPSGGPGRRGGRRARGRLCIEAKSVPGRARPGCTDRRDAICELAVVRVLVHR